MGTSYDNDALSVQIQTLQDTLEDNFSDSLLKLSYKYLDQYYLQIRRQSDRSFLLTLAFAALGGLVLLAGICGLLFFDTGAAGYLTTAAGLATDFISAVFFYLYNKSTEEMRSYYDRLVLAQNLAVAIKTAEQIDSPEDGKELVRIVEQLMQDYNQLLFHKKQA